MGSRSFTRMPSFTAVVQGAIALGGLIASAIGSEPFAGYVAVCNGVTTVIACRALPGVGRSVRPILVLLAAAFPLFAALWGETGLFWATAASVVASGTSFVAEGRRPGALRALALAVLILLYYGFLSSFLVLIRSGPGHRALVALALAVFSYEAASAWGRVLNRDAGPSRDAVAGVFSLIAGVVGCLAATLIAGVFLNRATTAASLLLLGSAVAGAAVLSHTTALRVTDDQSVAMNAVNRESFVRLSALLLAAPAFLYGFRLFLT